MKLVDVLDEYNVFKMLAQAKLQASRESVLYEGLITSYPPSSIISSHHSELMRAGATIHLKSPLSTTFSIVFKLPLAQETINNVIKTAATGGWFVAAASVVGKGINEKFKDNVALACSYLERSNNTALSMYIVFEAKYGLNVTEPITKKYTKLFHITPYDKVDKILKLGLSPRNESKLSYHPARIYLALSQKDLPALAEHMNDIREENNEARTRFVTLEIDIAALKRPGVRLLADPAFPEGVYTLSNINPIYIKVAGS